MNDQKHLLVIFLADSEILGEVFVEFESIGIGRATLVDSIGMGKIVEEKIPMVASFHHLLRRDEHPNVTLFIVVESEEKAKAAIRMLDQVVGGLDRPNSGLAFTIPIFNVTGLKPSSLD